MQGPALALCIPVSSQMKSQDPPQGEGTSFHSSNSDQQPLGFLPDPYRRLTPDRQEPKPR